jgi:phage terminase small subunit
MSKNAPKPSPKSLTPKQQRFVEEYLVDLNATQAAIRAGYSAKTADAIGRENLGKPLIAAAVEVEKAKRAERTEITADRVLEELSLLAFSNIDHYRINPDDTVAIAPGAPAAAIRAVASIKRRIIPQKSGLLPIKEVEIRLWDKPGPLKLAGQHVGILKDKSEHSVEVKVKKEVSALTDAQLKARAAALAAQLAALL